MCGIAGILRLGSDLPPEDLLERVSRMTQSLSHRGPDAGGTWQQSTGAVVFGHRRLSIIDLSRAGSQPMTSASGRWTISYNGEIYNTPEIVAKFSLDRGRFRGTSDTEVLLEAIEKHGIDSTLEVTEGMFAFAAWDDYEQTLWVARDRFGEKPLYYSTAHELFVFSSELQPIRIGLGRTPDIDRTSLEQLCRYGYVPAPHTIYSDVHKLLPGEILRVSPRSGEIRRWSYWTPASRALSPHRRSQSHSVDELRNLLADTVRSRLQSDVPLGAFLSGGVDSSLVVAMIRGELDRPLKTFSIGFDFPDYQESQYADQVARIFETEHTSVTITASDALGVIPQLPLIYDEPFADSSQIPTWLVCDQARRHVTVALSGDGADELFGGYQRYRIYRLMADLHSSLPRPLRGAAGRMLELPNERTWRALSMSRWNRILPSAARKRTAAKAQKMAAIFRAEPRELYEHLHTASTRILVNIPDGLPHRDPLFVGSPRGADLSWVEQSMLLDTMIYLPDDILTKVDRASMSIGLEVRSPFLDPNLFDFAWDLPETQVVRGGTGKVILKELLSTYIPRNLVERPKMGFGAPIGDWLRTALREWGDDLLDPIRLGEEGFFDPVEVGTLWTAHQTGVADHSHELWPILMFQTWHEQWH